MTSGVFTIPLISTEGPCGPPLDGFAAAPELRHFIAGPENSLLRVLLEFAAQLPPQFPLVTLYGPTGVGKSHLLNGLVERRRRLVPNTQIAFGTGADFARAFARAVDVDSVIDWRDKQRGCDFFVLDDLQEMSSKTAAQQELLHTLDALAERQIQTLLAIRQAPLDWKWMTPALRSRIEGGLIIPVATPAAATSDFIYRELSVQLGGQLNNPSRPTRAAASTYDQLRRTVLRNLESHPQTSTRDAGSERVEMLTMIAKAVAKHFQVKLADLLGPSRRHSVVHARDAAIYLARNLLKLSFDEIGQYFGGRDHTTVLYSWRKIVKLLVTNAVLKHDIEKLSHTLVDNFEIRFQSS